MDNQEIKEIFEGFFQKYKKTEGDDNTYTAFWSERNPEGSAEIVMVRCPADTTFKFFINGKKVDEVKEWEGFFPALDKFSKKYNKVFDTESFFSGMQEMT
ncbi:hypothetical protein [Desulfonatronospira sp.]|uniref:hypothetical protein n=1 Tax=Desulfonatronospira sp. TaxID=1962951 RepID=UPI0025C53AC3|nr:hypothetical protein [Desulfonatronospira sp.]